MIVSIKYVLIVSLVIQTIFVYRSYFMSCHNSLKEVKYLQKRLNLIYSQIESLTQDCSRLIFRVPWVLKDLTFQLCSLTDLDLDKQAPAKQYENVRRRMYSTTKELWFYVSHQLRRALDESLTQDQRQAILNEVAERKRWLLSDLEKLPALDGHDEWRRREADRVGNLVQHRLKYLQNPPNCNTAKKLVCRQDGCGTGCNIHHLVFCLVVAYDLRRTLVLEDYDEDSLFIHFIHHLSDTCTKVDIRDMYGVSAETYLSNVTALYIPILRRFNESIRPYFIPKDLAHRIARFNGDPYSWWIGQMVKYILSLGRTNIINSTIDEINFTLPIVGVHIRRTDKISEAAYHDIDEYMTHVADYYAQLELTHPVAERRVYLATDDVDVLTEAIVMYPQYKFVGDDIRAQTADTSLRHTQLGTGGILTDVLMLSKCDHVVGTFSSNVGRMAYELMQTQRIDAINRVTSLDDMYYFTVQENRLRKAVMRNKDIAFEVGDLILYKCVNVTSNGTVSRTNATGPIPWYKTEEVFIQHPYPEYEETPLYAEPMPHT